MVFVMPPARRSEIAKDRRSASVGRLVCALVAGHVPQGSEEPEANETGGWKPPPKKNAITA